MFKKIKELFTCNDCACNLPKFEKWKIENNRPIFVKINHFIFHSIWAIPSFFILLFIIFETTFSLGGYIASYIDSFWTYLLNLLWIQNIFFLAIWWGIFWLLVYLPNIIILYIFLYYLNDSGILSAYSKRFDKFLKKMKISWKWFLSMFLWFGCTVPAILSTSMIKNKKEQIIVVMSLPFISCSAKLPVFTLLVSAFIPHKYQTIVLFSLYFLWVLMAIIIAKVFAKILKHNECSWKYDLIVYKIPSFKNILKEVFDVIKDFMKKVGIFIIPVSIILSLMFSYPNKHESYGYKIWKYIWKVFEPVWFNEKMSISIIPGLVGKETIVSTLWSLYYIDDLQDNSSLIKKMKEDKSINIAGVISYMLFILFYTSCIGSVLAARSVLWNKYAFIFFLYPILLAYFISFVVYHILIMF